MVTRWKRIAAVIAISALAMRPVHAQRATDLGIRVIPMKVQPQRVAFQGESHDVAMPGHVLPVAGIVPVRQQRNSARGTLVGALIGAGLGVFVGDKLYHSDFNGGGARARFYIGGGFLGAGIGALIGHIVSSPHH